MAPFYLFVYSSASKKKSHLRILLVPLFLLSALVEPQHPIPEESTTGAFADIIQISTLNSEGEMIQLRRKSIGVADHVKMCFEHSQARSA